METKQLFSLLEAYSFLGGKIKKSRNIEMKRERERHVSGEMKRREWLPMSMYKGKIHNVVKIYRTNYAFAVKTACQLI